MFRPSQLRGKEADPIEGEFWLVKSKNYQAFLAAIGLFWLFFTVLAPVVEAVFACVVFAAVLVYVLNVLVVVILVAEVVIVLFRCASACQ